MGVTVAETRHDKSRVGINVFVRILEGSGFQNNPSHDSIVGPSPCGQGGSTVLKTTTLQVTTEFSDDAILNDKICILDALHLIHLRPFQLRNPLRKYSS